MLGKAREASKRQDHYLPLDRVTQLQHPDITLNTNMKPTWKNLKVA